MAKMNSAAQFPFDAESSITLRDEAAAAITSASTVNGTAKELDYLTSYWDSGVIADRWLTYVANVTVSTDPGADTAVIGLQVSADEAFTTPVELFRTPDILGKTGQFVYKIDVATLKLLLPTARYIRTIAVTTGAGAHVFDYNAYLM